MTNEHGKAVEKSTFLRGTQVCVGPISYLGILLFRPMLFRSSPGQMLRKRPVVTVWTDRTLGSHSAEVDTSDRYPLGAEMDSSREEMY